MSQEILKSEVCQGNHWFLSFTLRGVLWTVSDTRHLCETLEGLPVVTLVMFLLAGAVVRKAEEESVFSLRL